MLIEDLLCTVCKGGGQKLRQVEKPRYNFYVKILLRVRFLHRQERFFICVGFEKYSALNKEKVNWCVKISIIKEKKCYHKHHKEAKRQLTIKNNRKLKQYTKAETAWFLYIIFKVLILSQR